MATIEDLQQAGSELRGLAEEVRGISGPVIAASGTEVLSGGNLGDTLAEFIQRQRIIGLGIGADLDELGSLALIAAAFQELLESEPAVPPGAGPQS